MVRAGRRWRRWICRRSMRPIASMVMAGAAYEPSMMVALLLYAYARGMRSARAIERACEEDVAFRVIAAQQRPDHATIARFVERHERALAGAVRRGARRCAPRPGWRGSGWSRSTAPRSHANASRDADARLRADRPRDPRGGQGHRRGRGRALRRGARRRAAARAGDRARAARAGCARPSGGWTSGAPSEAKPIPRSRPERLKEAKRRLEEELWTECRANEAYEAYRARGVGEARPAASARSAAQALHAAADAGGARSTPPTSDSRLVKGDARLAAGLQRPGRRPTSTRSSSPPR